MKKFLQGLRDGLPIFFGYLGVSFAFGITAIQNGLGVMEAMLISMTNMTSAGQLAAVPIIVGGGTLIELALGQLVINLRYLFMSVSLSQKLDKSVTLLDRLIISFGNTDEIFAVATSRGEDVGRSYMYGLILMPYIGWSAGTALGAGMGTLLPPVVVSALGVAIYAMFVAIVIPQTKKDRNMLFCVLLSVALSCAFFYVPPLTSVPKGFVVIICALLASTVFAAFAPIGGSDDGE